MYIKVTITRELVKKTKCTVELFGTPRDQPLQATEQYILDKTSLLPSLMVNSFSVKTSF